MSLATAPPGGGPPDAKKFKFTLPTQVVVQQPLFDGTAKKETGEECDKLMNAADSNAPDLLNENGTMDFDVDEGQAHDLGCAEERNLKDSDENDLAVSESATFPEDLFKIVDTKPPLLNPQMFPPIGLGLSPNVSSPLGSAGQAPLVDFSLAMSLFQQAQLFSKNSFASSPKPERQTPSRRTPSTTKSNTPAATTPPPPAIPGALAVAASPAAQLFEKDDWSWHRNPAASIRSGGTNKQTPVWKYFVYNKAENLSRCIVGNCTYMLKGPHTSTLACHLKKHTAEYAEFQRLKNEYSRERAAAANTVGNLPKNLSNLFSGKSAMSGGTPLSRLNSTFPDNIFTNNNNNSKSSFNSMLGLSKNDSGFGDASPLASFDATSPYSGIFGNLPQIGIPLSSNPGNGPGVDSFVNSNGSGQSGKKSSQGSKGNSSMSNILNLLSARAAAAAAAQSSDKSSTASSDINSKDDCHTSSSSSDAVTKPVSSNQFHSILDLAGGNLQQTPQNVNRRSRKDGSPTVSYSSGGSSGLPENDSIVSDATCAIVAAEQEGQASMESAVAIAKATCHTGADQSAIDAANAAAVMAIRAAQSAAVTAINEAADAAISAIQANGT
ncbi:zinc finger BED domain-containing protein 39 [Ditylenchus destructor]|uniref:Zinc finger BED domain-containing protein 39 n=1 Tax=Ditylenchus destructor TaxID=166010 RepID=A0AAD4R177_9BILA|nr:zinc finger BED domain-containing protein 39 [Ditylenchus destructor]